MSRQRILIADDDISVIEMLCANLEKDYEVDAAHDGEEALAKIMNQGINRPDLIILDVIMPKVNGFDVAKKIKGNEVYKHIPIIMLTVKDQPLDKVIGLFDCGVNYYLTKPISINDLMILVLKILPKKNE